MLQVIAKVRSEPLACSGAADVQETLARLPACVEALVYSVAEVAEQRKGVSFEVYLDERQHACQSLLIPLMSEAQDTALCFHLPGEGADNPVGSV